MFCKDLEGTSSILSVSLENSKLTFQVTPEFMQEFLDPEDLVLVEKPQFLPPYDVYDSSRTVFCVPKEGDTSWF
jgi:hypothetical protein